MILHILLVQGQVSNKKAETDFTKTHQLVTLHLSNTNPDLETLMMILVLLVLILLVATTTECWSEDDRCI